MMAKAPIATAHAVVPPVRIAQTPIAPATSRNPWEDRHYRAESPTTIARATRAFVTCSVSQGHLAMSVRTLLAQRT